MTRPSMHRIRIAFRRPALAHLLYSTALMLGACATYPPVRFAQEVDYNAPLPAGAPALLPLAPGVPTPDLRATWYERDEILPALERSLAWTRTKNAAQHFPAAGISHARALASLEQFRELLESTASAEAFQRAFEARFDVYVSAGHDGRGGGVLFTGYCTPLLPGNTSKSARFRYPLHALPPDLAKAADGTILGQETPQGMRPYPTRREIESNPTYEPLELVWLEDRIDAYIAHVNGSAFVELPSGDLLRFGYAGKNGRPYSSLGRALVEEGEVPADEMSLAAIRRWAAQHPGRVQPFLDRNDSYVFFTPIDGNPRGSLNVEVTPRRTLATDKTLFPRGALTFVTAELPTPRGPAEPFRQLMLDQDTGGAIRTAGRADLYLGVGPRAERLSGAVRSPGQLYYFFVTE